MVINNLDPTSKLLHPRYSVLLTASAKAASLVPNIRVGYADITNKCFSPCPALPIQTPIVNSLRQILNPDISTTRQIRSSPRHLQNPVIRPCR